MSFFPKVITTSVVRSTQKGESHGGVYLVNLNDETFQQMVDWDHVNINWDGRGGDRGLRGIAFFKNQIFIAASDEIFIFDDNFSIAGSIKHQYLKHCHEIFINDCTLFLTSTGFNSILEYDLKQNLFVKGYQILTSKRNFFVKQKHPLIHIFDPNSHAQLKKEDNLHINNVFFNNNKIFISGTGMSKLWVIHDDRISAHTTIPFGTHNVTLFNDGILYNDSRSEQVIIEDQRGRVTNKWDLISYPKTELEMNPVTEDHARQKFGRGLCIIDNETIVGGSSPSTISVYNTNNRDDPVKTINLSMDIRNAIHGLEVWPYD